MKHDPELQNAEAAEARREYKRAGSSAELRVLCDL